MSETPSTTAPLTPEDIAYVAHRVARFSVGSLDAILAAPNDATAAIVAKQRAGIGGFAERPYSANFIRGSVITVEVDGTPPRAGTLTFLDVARVVRGTAVSQPSLL